jgi:hypothetical protein
VGIMILGESASCNEAYAEAELLQVVH